MARGSGGRGEGEGEGSCGLVAAGREMTDDLNNIVQYILVSSGSALSSDLNRWFKCLMVC